MSLFEVRLWDRTIGALSTSAGEPAAFQWDPAFAAAASAAGIEPAPLAMPVDPHRVYRTASSGGDARRQLPGLLNAALPGRWGQQLVRATHAEPDQPAGATPPPGISLQPDQPGSIPAVDSARILSLVGARACGAIECVRVGGAPSAPSAGRPIRISALAEQAALAVADPIAFAQHLEGQRPALAARQLVDLGSPTTGDLPAALVAFDPVAGRFHTAGRDLPAGFTHWTVTFDVAAADTRDARGQAGRAHGSTHLVSADTRGRHAHAGLAGAAGIAVAETRLVSDGARRHLLARRVDRTDTGDRLHLQTLESLIGPGSPPVAAEHALAFVQRLTVNTADAEQLLRRLALAAFTGSGGDAPSAVVFLMDRTGGWQLAPLDVSLGAAPADLAGTAADAASHSDPTTPTPLTMSIAGKRDGVTVDDLLAIASHGGIKRAAARAAIDEVRAAVVP